MLAERVAARDAARRRLGADRRAGHLARVAVWQARGDLCCDGAQLRPARQAASAMTAAGLPQPRRRRNRRPSRLRPSFRNRRLPLGLPRPRARRQRRRHLRPLAQAARRPRRWSLPPSILPTYPGAGDGGRSSPRPVARLAGAALAGRLPQCRGRPPSKKPWPRRPTAASSSGRGR